MRERMLETKYLVKSEPVESLVVSVAGKNVLIDRDVAMLYGVETKHLHQAIKNNPDKFPVGYVIPLDSRSKDELVKNFDHLAPLKFSHVETKAFTEKGLYMLATILKSPKATDTTIEIIESFAKLREMNRIVAELVENPPKERQSSLMQKSGEILSELLDSGLQTTGAETSFEINLAVMKFKHTVKRDKKAGIGD
jgi:phage regulator Rha-like protein